MAKLNSEDLHIAFDANLASVWEMWIESFGGNSNTSPFKSYEESLESDSDNDQIRAFYWMVAYCQAVHDALGWSLANPSTPKSWSPRKR